MVLQVVVVPAESLTKFGFHALSVTADNLTVAKLRFRHQPILKSDRDQPILKSDRDQPILKSDD